MKKLMNKNFVQKIVIAILIVLSFNFVVPTFSHADFGGLLWTPIRWLVTGIGDTILYWLNFFFVGFSTEQAQEYLDNPYKPANFNSVAKIGDSILESNRAGGQKETVINRSDMGTGKEIPIIEYSPDMIFANKVPGLDANYINPKTDYENTAGISIDEVSITKTLQETIATWYISLRNLVIVCLLSILLYVAIRMIISSTASDKAKYKKMLMDWLISFCLVFFMHYIMAFTMSLIEIVSQSLSESASEITVVLEQSDRYDSQWFESHNSWFNTNIMGYCRFMTQSDEGIETMGFTILYIALIVYTLKFTWEYMKRSIKMAFLTLMAPLVTLTYAIDKMGDGKAQAFNSWLKEYIFTALVQPFHLLIYSIFMGASMNIAARNPLYAILFLAFLTPAEKLLRKFFGFDKEASGGSSFAGGFGGAAAYNMLRGAVSKGAQGLQHAKGGGGQNSQIRQKNNNMVKDPNAPKGNLDSFKNGSGNESISGNNTENSTASTNNDRLQNGRETQMEAMSDVQSESFGTNDWDPQEYAAMQQGSNAASATKNNGMSDQEYDDVLRESGYSEKEIKRMHKEEKRSERLENYKQDQNWGIGKWASENFIKPTASKVGGGIKNIAGAASDKFKTTGVYKRAIAPGTKKIKDIASKASNRYKNSEFVKSGAARALKNSAKGALNVGGRALLKTGKIAGKLAAGAAVGAVGLGMGIAGDDLDDVLKYAGGGFALGYSAIPSLASNTIQDVKDIGSTIRNDYEIGAYGETEAALLQQNRNVMHDKALRTEEIERLTEENEGRKPTRQEINERMQQVAEYRNAGITDSSAMHKAMKIEKEINQQLQDSGISEEQSNKMSRNQAIEIAKLAEPYTKQELRNEDKVNDLRKDIMGKLTKGSNGLSAKEATSTCENIINNVKKIKGV